MVICNKCLHFELCRASNLLSKCCNYRSKFKIFKVDPIFDQIKEAAFIHFKESCTLHELANFCNALDKIKEEMRDEE